MSQAMGATKIFLTRWQNEQKEVGVTEEIANCTTEVTGEGPEGDPAEAVHQTDPVVGVDDEWLNEMCERVKTYLKTGDDDNCCEFEVEFGFEDSEDTEANI